MYFYVHIKLIYIEEKVYNSYLYVSMYVFIFILTFVHKFPAICHLQLCSDCNFKGSTKILFSIQKDNLYSMYSIYKQ